MTQKKDGGGSDPSDEEPSPPDLSPGGMPADVAGSFLVGCSSETGQSFLNDPVAGQAITACIIKDQSNAAASITVASVEADLGGEKIKPELVSNETNAPWHLGFKLTPEQQALLKKVVVQFLTTDGQSAIKDSASVDYNWAEDPIFQQAIDTVELINALASPPQTFDLTGDIAKFTQAGNWHHVIFVSDKIFSGDFGFEGAESHCQTAGARFLSDRKWHAFLSTTGAAVRDRIPIKGTIFDYAGHYLSEASLFWALDFDIKYSESGLRINRRAVVGVLPARFNQLSWTGTNRDGTFAAELSCGDWTSASEQSKGRSWNTTHSPSVAMLERSCDQKARLICISEVYPQ